MTRSPTEIVLSESDRVAIQEETERVMADAAFKGSKRCQSLLRYLIDHALDGDVGSLKERTLGIEVFGRDVDYDTASDPIVRIAANEIRKRLGQRYQEPSNQHGLRIRLVAGSYLPVFDFDSYDGKDVTKGGETSNTKTHLPAVAALDVVQPLSNAAIGRPPRPSARMSLIFASILILLSAAAVFSIRHGSFEHTDFLTWEPLLGGSQPLTICISDNEALVKPNSNTDAKLLQIEADEINYRSVPTPADPDGPIPVALDDADVAHKLTSWMDGHGKMTTLRPASAINLQDFRQRPMVLIGGFNSWSLILLSNLRYSVRVDPVTQSKWIQDSRNPTKRDWNREAGDRRTHTTVDYAVISRVLDTHTGGWILAFGGLWSYGTQAACDLLTEPSTVKGLPDKLRSAKNFQIVIKTSVVNEHAGPPEILAVYTW